MSWIATKLFFKKTWLFLKEYWQIPFMFLWTAITVVLTRRNTAALKDVIAAKQESHKKEVETLEKIHSDEIMKLKGAQKEYLKTIEQLEAKFKQQKIELTKKQTEDVKKIVLKSKGNPEEIIRKIENDFGIKFKN